MGEAPQGPWLFDLPLSPEGEPHPAEAPEPVEPPTSHANAGRDSKNPPLHVSHRSRFKAGLLDLAACVFAVIACLALAGLLGLTLAPINWAGVLLFALTFSFLYHVVPLSFWGQTPGMSLVHIRARSAQGEPLSLRQAALRWLGGVITVGVLGLPTLLPGGRSLADRLSSSRTDRILDATS